MNPCNVNLRLRDQRVCRSEIDLDALSHNLTYVRKVSEGAQIVAMVKANAYGHGSDLVSRYLEKQGVSWFGVATVEEGISLRENSITSRILVMSGSGAQFFARELVEYGLTPLLSSVDEIEIVREAARGSQFKVHLDIDTGMTRGGFISLPDPATLQELLGSLRLEGLSTHFSKAEDVGCAFTELQVGRFYDAFDKVASIGQTPSFVHLDKSASLLTRSRLQNGTLKGLVRPGIALYGIDPTTKKVHEPALKPILSWRAPIVLRKRVPAGTKVGYDCTYVTKEPTELALVRVGYGDGLDRRLSNLGHLLCAGVKAPILGRISMDLTVIDVTRVIQDCGESKCCVGEMVTIIGQDGEAIQSAHDLANLCQTIPYEILTSISSRVKRFET